LIEDNLVEEMHDIEELAERCQRTKICGYYASRNVALEKADVIVMPYQSILSESARTSLGIESLTDKIIVFDEAHNLLETITSLNSIEVTQSQLQQAAKHINEYKDRYSKRMAPKNVKALGDICMVFEAFNRFMNLHKALSTPNDCALDVMEVLVQTELYTFEFGKLSSFFEKADLVKKLNGYV
jgi:chromosome transmission fidelity protein 1